MDPQLSLTDSPLAGGAAAPPPPPAAAPVAEMADLADTQPAFTEMIMAAITALNEPGGSSSRAIGKYIERVYSNLPPGHSSLLTQHLKGMKNSGELVMVKHSYMLPGSAPPPPPDSTPGPKRKPGRPPKARRPRPGVEAKPELWVPEGQANADTQPEPVFASGGLDGGPSPARRGRGRPKKLNSEGKISTTPQNVNPNSGRRPGRPPKTGFVAALGVVGRPRGRPKRIASSTGMAKLRGRPKAISAGIAKKLGGRPRGRPAKNSLAGLLPGAAINVPIIDGETRGVPFSGAPNGVLLTPKRRGRPPKLARGQIPRSGNVNGIRKLSGKPLGRPRKNSALGAAKALESQQLVAFQDLQAKFENLKMKVRETAGIVKPCLNNEAMSAPAIAALQELEALAAGDGNPV